MFLISSVPQWLPRTALWRSRSPPGAAGSGCLGSLGPVDGRRQHAAGRAPPLVVVVVQIAGDDTAGFGSGGERGILSEKFELKGGVEALGHRFIQGRVPVRPVD